MSGFSNRLMRKWLAMLVVASLVAWVVALHQLAQPHRVEVRGSTRVPLQAGVAQRIDLSFANPRDVAVTISSVRIDVDAAEEVGCDVRVVDQLAATVHVPARSTRSLSKLGIESSAWPSVELVESSSRKPECPGATIRMRFTAVVDD